MKHYYFNYIFQEKKIVKYWNVHELFTVTNLSIVI